MKEKDKIKLRDRKSFKTFKRGVADIVSPEAREKIGNTLEIIGDLTGRDSVKAFGRVIKGSKGDVALNVINKSQEELDFELSELELYLGDIQNARIKEVELAKLGKSNWFHYFVGMSAILMLGFVLYVIVYKVVPDGNKTLFYHFVGMLEGVVMTIYSFEFGSSRGSKNKTELLNKR